MRSKPSRRSSAPKPKTETLIANNLVDQFNLMVFPVVLGSGKRLFGDMSEMKTLRLAESKPVGDGVIILVYRLAA